MHQHCACYCHCATVHEKVTYRLGKKEAKDSSVDLSRIIEGDEDEVEFSPISVRLRSSVSPAELEDDSCLCERCCSCHPFEEDGESLRQHPSPQVSLFYNPPTFLQDLCSITASSPAVRCRRVNEEECTCHGLWVEFFSEILNAYVERYTDSVGERNGCSLDPRDSVHSLRQHSVSAVRRALRGGAGA